MTSERLAKPATGQLRESQQSLSQNRMSSSSSPSADGSACIRRLVTPSTHIEDRHDGGMVQPGEDARFVQVGFHILGVSDAFRVRHLDRHGAVKIVIVGEINPSEPTLTETADDPVAPDPRGIAKKKKEKK